MPAAEILLDPSTLDFSRPILDGAAIEEIIPHRGAMRLVDGVVHLDLQTGLAAGYKDCRADEFWAAGHFPGNPLLPGVVMAEAAAQLALIWYKTAVPEIGKKLIVLAGLDELRFRGGVRPGDRLILLGRVESATRRGGRFRGQGVVNGQVVFEGRITALPI